MGRVYDRLETVFTEIIQTPTNFLDYDYMMGIFNDLQNEITLLKDYLSLMFKHRVNLIIHIVGSKKDEYEKPKVLGFDLLRAELFYP